MYIEEEYNLLILVLSVTKLVMSTGIVFRRSQSKYLDIADEDAQSAHCGNVAKVVRFLLNWPS